MTLAQLDFQNHPEQTSSDLTTRPLFIDSPVLFTQSIDQVNAHPSEQIEQTEHTTSSEVHTPTDNTYEIPPPPAPLKNATKILSLFTHLSSYKTFKTFTFYNL